MIHIAKKTEKPNERSRQRQRQCVVDKLESTTSRVSSN
jgi:hypothetical protein